MSTIPTSFLHSLPPAPHVDVSTIKGNISNEEKQLGANIFSYFVNSREESYGAEVGRRLRLVEMNIWGRDASGTAAQGQTIFEIDVEKDMCNVFGTLHGACAAYIVDPCSVSSLVVLGAAIGADETGVSQSLNVIWHQPAKMGTTLRVIMDPSGLLLESSIPCVELLLGSIVTSEVEVNTSVNSPGVFVHATCGGKVSDGGNWALSLLREGMGQGDWQDRRGWAGWPRHWSSWGHSS
ncbi:uncharacterized protein BT62DRAFT_790387 [Guyanagaster necrorhizus]|uniref:Thioesterase domain-containing protein n=1 Tax=Guyanagaster necrorhizus TaxID=856835 RepID=A0A9P8ATZ5_9AGAR|nr:uncharacterized protein BT62DRAFT_790387 [Guyanagaster necrorhizus MCA 3950]KAG7447740.1 hypothetical protein BT62DRAFT_790387 [Guyanagaster necrorhizus MCA 3950]